MFYDTWGMGTETLLGDKEGGGGGGGEVGGGGGGGISTTPRWRQRSDVIMSVLFQQSKLRKSQVII